MKKQCQNRNTDARAGFTLIEIVVAIVVFGILCAATMVSWSSFMRYQELRDSANAFHKELLAAKATALETGYTVKITYTEGSNSYTIAWNTEDENVVTPHTKPVSLNKNVTISAKPDQIANGELPHLSPDPENGGKIKNNWIGGIEIVSDNLSAFDKSGRVTIQNSSKKIFCIQKDDGSIKPLMYYKSGSGTWKKM